MNMARFGRMIKFADSESSFDDANFIIYGYPFEGTACFLQAASTCSELPRTSCFCGMPLRG